ncbi:MAG: outer membrane PBP1 activator LpoA protein [Halioglobus sp.]|jgi:outer membrane PBP1 activator LpoA protein
MTKYLAKRTTLKTIRNLINRGALIVITLVLSACEIAGPTKTEPVVSHTGDETRVIKPITAVPSAPASEFAQQFSAADQQLQKFDWMSAQLTLNTIRLSYTSDTDRQYLNYMDARIHYIRGDVERAQVAVQQLLREPLQPALERRALNLKRYISRLARDYSDSARAGDQLLRATPEGAEADSLKREIWRDLQRLPTIQRDIEEDAGIDSQWLAWMALAKIGASHTSPAQRKQELGLWRDKNPDHPAAEALPGGLDYLLNTLPKSNRVALLLPLSGKLAMAAGAIRDGFLASYYASRESGGEPFDVQIIDILDYGSATEAYQNAVAGGATMVVGPLGKFAVKEIGELADRPVPVLALNRTDVAFFASETAMVQLALSPEDEAEQIATVAYGRGARSALVIRPASRWGVKMATAFSRRWTSLGGTIVHDASYSGQEDYSQSVSNSLGLPASEQRAKDIRARLGTDVEFSPRRRRDIDAVFLFARTPAEARSIKPLLAYHYAGSLPVYATSSIYRGVPNTRDNDLNGITTLEIPWLLNLDSDAHSAPQKSDFDHDRYARLNALGADAFLIQSRFEQLQAGQDLLILGNTGLLSLSPKLQLKRELSMATFDEGQLVAQ